MSNLNPQKAYIFRLSMAENAGEKQRRRGLGRPFQPGQSGNPAGKPKGTRNRAMLLAEQLLDGETEALVRTAIELAKTGNVIALRMCLVRILPARHDRPVRFAMPALDSAGDAAKAMSAITTAVDRGKLTPSEAAELSRVIEAYVKAFETSEIERRLKILEGQQFAG
jgi:Family of unknown function (DUF5681)